jgi:hypothetical protein
MIFWPKKLSIGIFDRLNGFAGQFLKGLWGRASAESINVTPVPGVIERSQKSLYMSRFPVGAHGGAPDRRLYRLKN